MITPNAPIQFSGLISRHREAKMERAKADREATEQAEAYYKAVSDFLYPAILEPVKMSNRRFSPSGNLYSQTQDITGTLTIGGKPYEICTTVYDPAGRSLHSVLTGPDKEKLEWTDGAHVTYTDKEGQTYTTPDYTHQQHNHDVDIYNTLSLLLDKLR